MTVHTLTSTWQSNEVMSNIIAIGPTWLSCGNSMQRIERGSLCAGSVFSVKTAPSAGQVSTLSQTTALIYWPGTLSVRFTTLNTDIVSVLQSSVIQAVQCSETDRSHSTSSCPFCIFGRGIKNPFNQLQGTAFSEFSDSLSLESWDEKLHHCFKDMTDPGWTI